MKTTSKIKTSEISTVLGMSLLLFLLGFLAYLLVMTNSVVKEVKQQMVVDVYLKDNAREVDVRKLEKKIDVIPYVLHAQYISKDSARAILMEQQGEDVFEILDDVVPLKELITVNLSSEYVNKDSTEKFKQMLLAENGDIVDEIFYNQAHFLEIGKSFKKLELFLLIIASILLLISILLINNTIRLAIFSKRFLIRTMQLVGAKSTFIRRPFLFSAIVQGFVAGVIAIILLMLMGYLLADFNPEVVARITQSESTFQKEKLTLSLIFAGIIIGGIFISYLSTLFALNKYLWIKTDKLF